MAWGSSGDTADVRGDLTFRLFVASGNASPGSCHLDALGGPLGPRTRVLPVILRTAASREMQTQEHWLRPSLLSKQRPPDTLNTKYSFICQRRLHGITSGFVFMPFFFFLEGIYICIYSLVGIYSQEYSVRNTKVLRKKLLKISSRLQENCFHMVRPESPVLVVQRQLGRVLLPKLRVQKCSRTGRFRKVGLWCWVNPGLPGTTTHP